MKRMLGSFVLSLLCVPALFAQMPDAQKPAMMPDCAAMMQQHEAMQKHMAEMDAKLQTLVDEMNKAKGSAKVDKMAAVITELVTQRAMIQKQMADMEEKMMAHMMEHMQDNMKAMSDSMANCPMMKKSEKAQTPPAAEHQH
jgi:hypothetical protein